MKSFKRFLFATFLMFASVSVYSGNLSVNGGVVYAQPGTSGKIDIYMNNTDTHIEVVQFDLVVPAGVTLKTNTYIDEETDEEITEPVCTVYRNLTNGVISYGYDSDTRTYHFAIEPASGKYVSATEGVLISIGLNFASSFEGGNAKLTTIGLFGDEDEYPEDVAFRFEVGNPSISISLKEGWNSYCSHENLDFTDLPVKAYVVTEVSTTIATLAKVDKIPAQTGFLIESEANSEINVPIISSVSPIPDDISKNKLTGVIRSTKISTEGNYVLSEGKFVMCSTGTLPANKAYLKKDVIPPSTDAKGITIVFDGNTTGINEIQKAETDGAIYNLSGMRVSKTQKGVYIMNGRKVIVK